MVAPFEGDHAPGRGDPATPASLGRHPGRLYRSGQADFDLDPVSLIDYYQRASWQQPGVFTGSSCTVACSTPWPARTVRALASTAPGSASAVTVRWAVAASIPEVTVHTCRSWTSSTPGRSPSAAA